MNFIIHHPQTNVSVQVYDGETPDQAIARYNQTILGFEPSGPVMYPLDPSGPQIYTQSQLLEMKGQHQIKEIVDPETNSVVPIDEYIATYYGSYFPKSQPVKK